MQEAMVSNTEWTAFSALIIDFSKTILSCGIHACPQRCHQLHDHSKMPCDHLLYSQCPKWQRQKDTENGSKPAIDSIMEMICLEDVKSQVLRIKAKIDTTTRQNSTLKNERFNISLLGNSGTGMLFSFQRRCH